MDRKMRVEALVNADYFQLISVFSETIFMETPSIFRLACVQIFACLEYIMLNFSDDVNEVLSTVAASPAHIELIPAIFYGRVRDLSPHAEV